MKQSSRISNAFNDDKVIDSCGLFGMMSRTGRRLPGSQIIKAMANMHDRGNGLGGGFAAYGIYPEYADYYALHLMFESMESKAQTESLIRSKFALFKSEEIPHDSSQRGVRNVPILWRYFVTPLNVDEANWDDFVVSEVMNINVNVPGAFVFSSGKDMGVFKGVGYPEDIGKFFCLDEYKAYLWVGHGRFPTNTQGWWGGAHPFSILDWTVVHNGEISSYGTNRAFLEMYGYYCTMHTDTEVIAYAVDLLMRRHRLPVEILAKVLAPPLWEEIDRMSDESRQLFSSLRIVYGSLLMNGPFTVIIAHQGEMIGLGDRIRLRPLVAGVKDDLLFISSEEAPIRLICPDVQYTWIPKGGEPVVGRINESNFLLANAV